MGMTMKLLQIEENQLENIIRDNDLLFNLNPYDKNISLDIDKSWDILTFLLNKIDSVSELSQIICSGQTIGNFDSYDIFEVNYLSADQVKKIIIELNKITESDLQKAFDADAINSQEIYLSPIDESAFNCIPEIFKKIQNFYTNAVKNKYAIISFIS